MSAQCGFCRRSFTSKQGVRAHLKSCPRYQPMIRKQGAIVMGKSFREPWLPKAARTPEQIAEEIRLQREKDDWAWRNSIEGVVNRLYGDVVECHGPSKDVAEEARNRVRKAIDKKIRLLPRLDLYEVMDHNFEGLICTAEQIRDRVYRQYQLEQEVIKKLEKEVEKMSKIRLLTGIFICPKCEEEFELDREPENLAICEDCRVALEELDEDESDEYEEE